MSPQRPARRNSGAVIAPDRHENTRISFHCYSDPETALETAVADVAAPARNFAGQMAAAVEAEAMRAETRRSAAERAMQAQQRQEALEAGSAIGPGQVRLDEARLLAGASPDTGKPTPRKNGSFGNGYASKPWNAAPGRFAVRRWRRPTGNWTGAADRWWMSRKPPPRR